MCGSPEKKGVLMNTMTASERFAAYLAGKPVDRVPAMEWAPWWNLTVERWLRDGLPPEHAGYEQLQGYFGLDKCLQTNIGGPRSAATPPPPGGVQETGAISPSTEPLEGCG